MMLAIFFLFSAFYSPTAFAQPGYDIVIVAGQSNALGCGCGPFEDVSRAEDGKIYQMGDWGWPVQAQEPLRFAPRKNQGGKGFGMTFARLYATSELAPDRHVLLVPVGVGGTSLLQWDDKDEGFDFGPPTNNADPMRYDSTELYDSLLNQTEKALRAGSGTNRIVAFLWHQGETDLLFMYRTEQPINRVMATPKHYEAIFKSLISKFRQHFPAEKVPVVAGELGRFLDPPFGGENGLVAFNGMLQRAAHALEPMAIASSEKLGNGIAAHCSLWPDPKLPDGDPVHFNAASQVEFGKRYFSAWKKIAR